MSSGHRGRYVGCLHGQWQWAWLFAQTVAALLIACCLVAPAGAQPDRPPSEVAPPAEVIAKDHPWDGGHKIDVLFRPSPDDDRVTRDAEPSATTQGGSDANGAQGGPSDQKPRIAAYIVSRAEEFHGVYEDVAFYVPEAADYRDGWLRVTVDKCERGEPYFFRVRAVASSGAQSGFAETSEAAIARRQWFDGGRIWMLLITVILCGAVVTFILIARSGRSLRVRRIAGLEAVDEAVGRATEMGRSVLFIPGIQDMNDIQTIAGLTILARVARTAAEYDARVEVPTSRSLVMTAARETVQSAFMAAGRPDAYDPNSIYYVTDEQFGYVAYLSGMMVREKPAACFYMGSFFAESLILAETGNAIGAIQVAGTAQPAQLPFFVAACDYTLIGEEFFAASAYLSGEPDQLGSLKGQDVGKLVVGAVLIIGCGLATMAAITGSETLEAAVAFLKGTMLR